MALAGLQLCHRCSLLPRVTRLSLEILLGAKPALASSPHNFVKGVATKAQRNHVRWYGCLATASPTGPDSLAQNKLATPLGLADDRLKLGDTLASPFEEISDEDAAQINIPPPLPSVSVTLRDFVDQSDTLQKLLLLGVDLSKLEQRRNVGSMLLRLDFERDVRERLLFLKDVGLEDSQLGQLITRNPFFLTEDLDNLKARISYLKSMKFKPRSVARMIARAPYLLNFSVERLDNRLAFYQKTLGLSAEKTRDLVSRLPRLLCGSLEPVKENLKVYELELGFKANEIQHMVTRVPKILTASKKKLQETFDYLHNVMGVPHALLVKFPQVFNSKVRAVKERHLFLQYLGKAQYDPAKPSYVSLDRLVSLSDEAFCSHVASASLEDFELFQKTL